MKQDRNGVRTAQDLERKYDFSSIDTLKRNYELQKTSLNKVENELNNFVEATTQNIEDLQNQVDGNITTWFSSGIPTLNNYPANEWTDNDTKNNHLGDLYYDKNTGYGYRFTLEENTYKWIEIKDTDVTQALALANAAQDTADSKRRVFVVQPTPPYDVGDLWLNNEELYRCQITKGESETYASRDWIKATKYTDDTVANQVGNNLTILSGTVTEIRDDVDELSTTMTNTTTLVNEQGETIGTLQEQQSSTSQTVTEISATVASHGHAIDNLEDTVEEHENQLTPTDTSSGSSIYLEDSAETELIDFEVEGKTTQETRSGKNLLIIPDGTYLSGANEITATIKDGIITLNGTTTGNRFITIPFAYTFEATAYTLSTNNVVSNANVIIRLDDNILSQNSSSINAVKTETFTASTTVSYFVIRVANGTTLENFVIKPQLEKGSQATSWEQYGVMPSPDYPSELVSVGYENLLNVETSNIATSSNPWTNMSVSKGVITFNGVPTSSGGTNLYYNSFKVKRSGTYKFSSNMENAPSGSYSYMILQKSSDNSNWSTVYEIRSDNTNQSVNVSLNTSEYYRLRFYATSTTNYNNTIYKPMLEYGNIQHSHIPYGKYGIEVKTNGKNLFDEKQLLKAVNWQKNDDGYYYGTRSDLYSKYKNTSGGFSINCNFKENTQYTISFIAYSNTASGNPRLEIYYTDGTSQYTPNYNTTTPTLITRTSSAGKTIASISYGYGSGSSAIDYLKNIQLEEGNQATSYEPYIGHTNLIILDNPLRSIGDTKDLLYIKNGMLYVERKIGSVVLDGSESWNMNPTGVFNEHYILDNKYLTQIANSNYFLNVVDDKITNNSRANAYLQDGQFSFRDGDVKDRVYFKCTEITSVVDWQTWLSTHNTEVQYILAEQYTEELGQVTIPSTYKGITHIDTTDELEPNMSIIYVRDLPLTNYVESHYAELKIKEDSIETRVESIENSGYGDRISAVETKQTSTDLKVNVISTNSGIELDYDSEGKPISGKVREVTTTTGFTFNAEGMTIADSSSSFKAQHKKDGTYYYDGDTIVGQYTKDGSKQKDLELFGVYTYGKNDINDTPMFIAQLFTDGNGEEGFGHFYNRGD